MNEIDRIISEAKQSWKNLGLTNNPFSESAELTSINNIAEVFTGRRTELKRVISTLIGHKRKRILVYG